MQRVIPPRIGRWLFLCLCASLLALVALDSSGASHSISPPRLSLRTAASTTPAGTPDAAPSSVVKLRIDGPIEPILAEYLVNGIHEAGGEHASLILITMDTPGGLDTSMREIISAILASPVPVAIFVEPTSARAASAGFFILLS